MAVIFQNEVNGKRYQVRRAGNSIRLYTDGVFHSQYNPKDIGSGSLWDMLALPRIWLPSIECAAPRILVLGVGGGAILRYLMTCLPSAHIVGVDLDAEHLNIAQCYFGVQGESIQLVQCEAQRWVNTYRGPKFDLVVDDLFGECFDASGRPVRAVTASVTWVNQLRAITSPVGLLTFNMESPAKARALTADLKRAPNPHFAQALMVSGERYENVVTTLLPTALSRDQLYRNMPNGALRRPLPYTTRRVALF